MNKIFLTGAALAALGAVPALAQPGGEGRARFAQPQTRAAVEAQVQARFARADSNRDGFVTPDEAGAVAEARAEPRQERRGGMRGGFGGRRFAMLDLDQDGRVALAEAQRAALQRFDRVDSRDGTISPDERQAAREAWRERRQESRED